MTKRLRTAALLTALFLVGLVACKTPLKVVDTTTEILVDKTQVDVKTTAETDTKIDSRTSSRSDTAESSTEQTIKVDFDTSVPADASGNHPVKSVTTTVKITGKGITNVEQTEDHRQEKTQAVSEAKTQVDVRKESEQTHVEKPKYNVMKWLAISLIAIAIVTLVIIIRNAIPSILKKLLK